MKSNWLYYGLVVLAAEKTVQHIFVTFAFYYNWGNIASTVVVSPRLLMISGAVIAVLFAISWWGLLTKHSWSVDLLIALAAFDILAEFVAQGTFAIAIPVSFLVAVILFILAIVYRRQVYKLGT